MKKKYVLIYGIKKHKVFILAKDYETAEQIAKYYYPLSLADWKLSLYKIKAKTKSKKVTKQVKPIKKDER